MLIKIEQFMSVERFKDLFILNESSLFSFNDELPNHTTGYAGKSSILKQMSSVIILLDDYYKNCCEQKREVKHKEKLEAKERADKFNEVLNRLQLDQFKDSDLMVRWEAIAREVMEKTVDSE